MLKRLLIVFIAVFIFTQGLLVIHNSKYEKGEYDNICHALYDEKFWIDTCYIPYNSEKMLFEGAVKAELIGMALISAFYILKKKTTRP